MTPAEVALHARHEAAGLMRGLTPRQREIIVLASTGLTSQAIADMLQMSLHTVNEYRGKAMRRLGVSSIQEAAVIAAKAGLV